MKKIIKYNIKNNVITNNIIYKREIYLENTIKNILINQ